MEPQPRAVCRGRRAGGNAFDFAERLGELNAEIRGAMILEEGWSLNQDQLKDFQDSEWPDRVNRQS